MGRRKTDSDYLYMQVSTDKYELPLAVADNWKDLAELIGCSRTGIFHTLKNQADGKATKRKFVKVKKIK